MRTSGLSLTKFTSSLKELRFHLCPYGASSKGIREYVAKQVPILKKNNPELPILVRECSGIQPRLWARYDLGRETSFGLKNQKAADIQKHVEAFGK